MLQDSKEPLLSDAIAQLDDVEQRVLHLYYNKGFDWVEISERIDVPERELRQTHRRAVLRLYELLIGTSDVAANGVGLALEDLPDVFVAAAGDEVAAARLLGMGATGSPSELADENIRLARTLAGMTTVIGAAGKVWDLQVVPVWLRSRNAHLDGARPIDVIYLRGAREVLQALEAETVGAFA